MANSIVISSGHGKYVSGAVGIINEVTEARRVVAKVAALLRSAGVNVTEYHDNESRNQSQNINTIVAYHNRQQRDVDVSVHFNAASRTDAPRGTEVLYYDARTHASQVSAAIAKAGGFKDRGPKERKGLGFLRGTNKPALLIEVCFVDSSADVERYRANFDAICVAVAESISGVKMPKQSDPAPPPSGSEVIHIVQRGETLGGIAQKYGTTVAKLQAANGIKDPNKISVGQKLVVSEAQYHTVSRGETVSVIAQRYGTTVANVVKLNGLKDPNKISVGQKLRVK